MRLILSWVVALGAIVFGQALAQDRGPASLIPIAGHVVDAESGVPIPNARVSTSVTGVGYPVVLSDAEGRFSFQMPSALRYIAASKTGFSRQEAEVAPNVPVEIRLSRAAAISGRITDENGDPVVALRVNALRFDPVARARTTVATSDTDDRGEYRIGGLGGDPTLLATTSLTNVTREGFGVRASAGLNYYPGTAAIEDAMRIVLKPGEERAGLDFVIPVVPGVPANVLASVNPSGFGGDTVYSIVGPRPAPKGTAVVRGRLVSGDGRAIPLAEIRLTPSEGAALQTARSDADGIFSFVEVAAGRYRLQASKSGYFQPPSGSGGGPAPFMTIADGERRENLEILLQRFGVIDGRVVDERGDPLQGAVVQLMTVRYENGRRTLGEVNIPARTTDDRGYYRLHSIRPGQYIVSAAIGDVSTAELPQYARAFYPGTSDASLAQYVDVRSGTEITGVELPLTRIRTARVSGKLFDAQGRPTMGGAVKLVPSLSSVVGVSVGARIENDGDFEFVNVAPGQYVVQVSRGRASNWTEGDFIAYPVSVGDADVTGLVLKALAPSTVEGRISFETLDPGKFPARNGIDIVPVPVDPLMAPAGNLATALIQEDWSFELGGITGVRRLLATRLPRGWALQAVRVNGIDVTDRAMQFGGDERSLRDVEIVLTDRVSSLNGTVVDGRATLLPGAGVVAFSLDRENWYPSSRFLRRANSDAAGTFNVQGLPSGTYHVAAVPRLPSDGADAWQDPAYLESLRARASTISIMENQPTAVRLQVR